jgi:6-phosphogluconate dehydrogenase
MKRLLQKIESKILTKLFTRWVGGEFDIELLQMTKNMIESRENELQLIIGYVNKKEIKGFGKTK